MPLGKEGIVERRVTDLGQLQGRVLVYGGPYSNLHATRALFAWADSQGIPPDRRICTGDLAAYCADPVETAERVMADGGAIVAGNCERQLGTGAEDCGCGFEDGSACDLLSGAWYAHARNAFAARPDLMACLSDLPDILTFTKGSRRFAVLHGGATDIARFLFEVSSDHAFADELRALGSITGPVDTVIAGHSGLPFKRRIGDVLWINAGAIGLPAHDGHPETSFAVLEEDGSATFRALSYDHAAAATAMRAAGLTQGYDRALLSGWWPSEDVLPNELRRDARADDAPAQAT